MSRFTSLSRRLAIEDADTDIGEVEMVPAPEAEAPAAMAEVTEAGQEVEEITGAIGEASDDIDELETVGEIVSDSIEPEVAGGAEGPGMEPVAAALAAETVKRLRKKWGLSSPQSMGAPALESFGRASSRKQATRLALLGITDTIKKVWEKIKSFFKGLWEKIRNAVVSIFQSNLKTQKRAQTLLKELNTNSNRFNAKADKDKVSSGSICTTFNDEGKSNFVIAKGVVERHIGMTEVTQSFNESLKHLADGVGNVISAFKGSAVPPDAFDKLSELVKTFIGGVAKVGNGVKSPSGGSKSKVESEVEKMLSEDHRNNVDYTIIGPFVRGKYMYGVGGEKQVSITLAGGQTKNIVKYQVKIGVIDAPSSPASECDTLKLAEMTELCKLVISGCEKVAASERAQKLGDDTSKDVFNLIDNAIKVAQNANDSGDDAGSDTRTTIRDALNMAKDITNAVISGLSTANATMRVGTMSALNTGLDYVAQSMKNYKK